MNLLKYITPRNIAVLILVLMCIRYIPLETRGGVSPIKTVVSAFAPALLLIYSPKFSKAFFLGSIFFLCVLFSALFNLESFRASTILYLASLIGLFIAYYNLVYLEKVFTLDFFILLLKRMILAYTIVLLIQQASIVVGMKYFPLINLTQVLNRGIGANSLSGEPSSSARILAVLFLSLLRMYEIKWGKANVTIKAIYSDAKWVILGFLWSMITMGSGTAFVGLAVLSLYFIKKQYVFTVVPLLMVLYVAAPYLNFKPLTRAYLTIEASMTLDQDAVSKADGSASARVIPIINTLTETDLTDKTVWFGKGIDTESRHGSNHKGKKIGGITEYGFLSYLLTLVFLFNCVIYRFFSLETLLSFVLVGLTINNFAYIWGFYLVLTTVRYFQSTGKIMNHQPKNEV